MQQTQITTKDLGNGYYEHEMTVTTYYLYESVVSPVNVNQNQLTTSQAVVPKNSLGKYQPYRLTSYIEKNDVEKQKGEVVKLAGVEGGKLKINEKAMEIFRKYPDNQIAFVGNYGESNSGKSFWYDTILELSEVDGNPFTHNKGEPGLYIWSIPYARDNMRVFLLDNVQANQSETLTAEQQKILDLELLLSEKLVVIPEPGDDELKYLDPTYHHLKDSQERFSHKGVKADKFSPYWPQEVYTLYRSPKPVAKDIDEIGTLFDVYNFSIIHDALVPGEGNKQDLKKSSLSDPNSSKVLNEKYVRMTSIVFQDIMQKMKGKQYDGVRYTGNKLPQIITQTTTTINNGQGVVVDSIFQGVRDDLYDHTIKECLILYNKELEPIRSDPNPQPVDVLTDNFQRGNQAALKKFDQEVIDPTAHSQYEKKLQKQIDKIEADILRDNERKTILHYKSRLPESEVYEKVYVSRLKRTFENQKEHKNLDHSDDVVVSEKIKNSMLNKKGQPIIVPLTQKEKVQELQRERNQRQKQLDMIYVIQTSQIKDKIKADEKELLDKHEDLVKKSTILKEKVNNQKDKNKDLNPQQKEFILSVMRSKHKQNQEELSKIQGKNPNKEVQELQERLKRSQMENNRLQNGLSLIQRSFVSQKSSKSLIRDIKSENIHKPVK